MNKQQIIFITGLLAIFSLTVLIPYQLQAVEVKEQSKKLSVSANLKFQQDNCPLLSGYSLLQGCMESPFATFGLETKDNLTYTTTSTVKIQSSDISKMDSLKSLNDQQTSVYGLGMNYFQKQINVTTAHGFAFQRSWLLSDLRNMGYVAFKNQNAHLDLTQSALQLLVADFQKFSQKYGEMYVQGYNTGAWFKGLMTLSTNDVTVYNQILALVDQPEEQQVEALKQQYGSLLDVDFHIESSLQLTKRDLFSAHTQFQQKLSQVNETNQVSVKLQSYELIPQVRPLRLKLSQITKDYFTVVRSLRDSTIQSISDVKDNYNFMKTSAENRIEAMNSIIQKPEDPKFLIPDVIDECEPLPPKIQLPVRQGTPQDLVTEFKVYVGQIEEQINKAKSNLKQLNSLTIQQTVEIDKQPYSYEPLQYELIYSFINNLLDQSQLTMVAERQRQTAELIFIKNETKKIFDEQEKLEKARQEKIDYDEQRKLINSKQRQQPQEESIKNSSTNFVSYLQPLKLVNNTLNQGNMIFYQLNITIPTATRCSEVLLNFKQLSGQLSIYTSQSDQRPYVINSTNDFITGYYYQPEQIKKTNSVYENNSDSVNETNSDSINENNSDYILRESGLLTFKVQVRRLNTQYTGLVYQELYLGLYAEAYSQFQLSYAQVAPKLLTLKKTVKSLIKK